MSMLNQTDGSKKGCLLDLVFFVDQTPSVRVDGPASIKRAANERDSRQIGKIDGVGGRQ